MIIKELDYHYIEDSYGGNQEWFFGPSMKLGGCGAETACECSIYFSMYKNKDLYPFDLNNLSKKDYRKFGTIMKPYLSPRMSGIDKVEIFIDGYNAYLADRGESRIKMLEFPGTSDVDSAKTIIRNQIDKGLPVPMLMLKHKDKKFKDYEWHWFILNGYKYSEDEFFIKAVTYSNYEWLDLDEFWNTGFSNKGGLVVFEL